MKITKYVDWDNLSSDEKMDIIENIYRECDYFENGSWNINTLKEYFDDEINFKIPVVKLDVKKAIKDAEEIWGTPDNCSQKNLDVIRKYSILHPIISNNGKFFDGGHRLTVANERGMKTIDAYEISHLLNWNWEKFDDGEPLPKLITEMKEQEKKNITTKFAEFKQDKVDKFKKTKEFEPLSDDILALQELEDGSIENIKGPVEIVQVTGIIQEPNKIKKLEETINAAPVINTDLRVKTIKRGDVIWLTCLLQKPGSTSWNTQQTIGCVKVRVIDFFYGLNKLKYT